MTKLKIYLLCAGVALLFISILSSILLLNQNIKYRSENKALSTSLDQSSLEIQSFSKELNTAKSTLTTESLLKEKYKEELSLLDSKFKQKIKEYDLKLASRSEVTTVIKNRVIEGETKIVTNTITEACQEELKESKLYYSWQDTSGRFKFNDLDIFTPNNEKLDYTIYLSTVGYIYKDKSGSLQVQKLVLKELIPVNKDGQISYEEIPSKIELVDAKYEYSAYVEPKSILDIFQLKTYALYDTQLNPGIGLEPINLGNYIDYLNLGVGLQTSINIKNIQDSNIGISLNYRLIRPLLNTNLGIGIGVLTPVSDILNKYMITGNVIFYLN